MSIAIGLLLSISGGLQAAAASTGDCASAVTWGCPEVSGNAGDGQVDLVGSQTTPGSPGSGADSAPPAGESGTGGDSGGSSTPVEPERVPWYDPDTGQFLFPEERTSPPATPTAPAPPAAGTPAVTLSDLASFIPERPIVRMEPDGWMVVGLPTNFIAASAPHVVPGTLLGAPAEVRFTPVQYAWQYGDGESRILSTPGATWRELGLAEFDETPTSHVYDEPGEYDVELTVGFAPEYRIGGGAWVPIPGVVAASAAVVTASAGDAVTVLVDRDCAVDPSGPGC